MPGYSETYKQLLSSNLCPNCGGGLGYNGLYDLYCVGKEKLLDGYIQIGTSRSGCGFSYVDSKYQSDLNNPKANKEVKK